MPAAPSTMPPTRPAVRGVFPHGAQRGTDIEITIRGTNLQDSNAIRFVAPGYKEKQFIVTAAENAQDEVPRIVVKLDKQ